MALDTPTWSILGTRSLTRIIGAPTSWKESMACFTARGHPAVSGTRAPFTRSAKMAAATHCSAVSAQRAVMEADHSPGCWKEGTACCMGRLLKVGSVSERYLRLRDLVQCRLSFVIRTRPPTRSARLRV